MRPTRESFRFAAAQGTREECGSGGLIRSAHSIKRSSPPSRRSRLERPHVGGEQLVQIGNTHERHVRQAEQVGDAAPCRAIDRAWRGGRREDAGAERCSCGEIHQETPGISDTDDVTLAPAVQEEAAHGRAHHGVGLAARSREQRPRSQANRHRTRHRFDGRRPSPVTGLRRRPETATHAFSPTTHQRLASEHRRTADRSTEATGSRQAAIKASSNTERVRKLSDGAVNATGRTRGDPPPTRARQSPRSPPRAQSRALVGPTGRQGRIRRSTRDRRAPGSLAAAESPLEERDRPSTSA